MSSISGGVVRCLETVYLSMLISRDLAHFTHISGPKGRYATKLRNLLQNTFYCCVTIFALALKKGTKKSLSILKWFKPKMHAHSNRL